MTADVPDVAIVVAGGAVPERAAIDAAWPGWGDGRRAGRRRGRRRRRNAAQLGLAVDELVGDLDSIAPDRLAALRAAGVSIETWPRDKDASDTELAVRAALRHRPGRIVILGALGGLRPDHAMANVGLLGLAELAGSDVVLLDGVESDAPRSRAGRRDPGGSGRRPGQPAADRRRCRRRPHGRVGLPAGGRATRWPARPAACPTFGPRTIARIRVASGRLLVIEVVAPPEVLP